MSEDLAKLVIKLEAETGRYQRELDRANKKLGRFQKGQTEALKRVKTSFVGVTTAVVGLVSAGAGLSKLVSSARSFDVINASLITATGSAEKAKQAFEAITDFAATTPFQLNEVADGFIKLTNLGLVPSEAALTSYGNTASAMGKSLNQMIEAVADAATGEFERLKEFGIKAKSEGDRVTFTFRGVATEVGKNAAEIEEYLRNLGDIEFAGAMEARANSLDGALSNLEDSFEALFRTASQDGGADQLVSSVRTLSELLQDPKTIQSAQTLANLLIGGFSNAAKAVNNAVFAIDVLLGQANDLAGVQLQIEQIERILEGGIFDKFAVTERLFTFGIIGDDELEARLQELKKERAELLQPPPPSDESDRLAEFGVGGAKPIGGPEPTDFSKNYNKVREENERLINDLKKDDERRFQNVQDFLMTENEAITAAYEERRQIIVQSATATEEEKNEAMRKLTEKYYDEILPEIEVKVKRVQKTIQDNAESQAEAFDRIFGAGALTQLFSDLDNIEDRFKSLLANIAAQAAASGIASMFNGGSFGGGVGDFFGGLFGGARADGGPVSAGSMYMVGERGPEMFVPNVSGSIVPNHSMGGATVNMTVVTKDADSFRRSQGQIQTDMASALRRAGRNA